MNILLLTDRMDNGGAETHIAMLARGLRALGHHPAVLSSGGRLSDELALDGIPQYLIPPIGKSLSRLSRARQAVRELVQQQGFQILHAHTRTSAQLLRGCRRWKNTPAPIVTMHAAFCASLILSPLSYWGEKTIAVSEDLRALACDRFGVPAETITVIPNGVDQHIFSPPPAEAPPGTVLFASRLDQDCARGASLLCELALPLAYRFPDLKITIAGGGSALPMLREQAKKINTVWKKQLQSTQDVQDGQDLIRLTGTVTDMPELYRSHRIFVGVSRAALEAAACGCAVILCGNEGYGGLLSPDSPEPALSNFCCRGFPPPTAGALNADLSHLLESDFFARTSAAASLAWVAEEYSAKRMVEETVAVYHTLQHM